jgi:FkbM family methyltransferase
MSSLAVPRLERLSLRSQVKSQLQRHPIGTRRLGDALGRVGSARLAQRLVAAADIVMVRPPLNDAHPFAMKLVQGSDQIAAAIAAQGWLGFERPLPDVFAALVRAKGGLVLDVGANTGFYALVAVSVDPRAEVHVFEPYPPVLDLLHANLTINTAASRVRVFEEAVGCERGHVLLHIPDPSHGLVETSASLNPVFRVEGERTSVPVTVTTLDDHIASSGRHARVGVIKVDVESLEHEVIAGASGLLAIDRPYVIVEVLPTSDIDALEAARASCGYVDVCLRPHEAVVGSAIAFDPDGWNHLFIPVEALDEGTALVGSCGLAVRG